MWSNHSQGLTTQGTRHRGHTALSHTPRGFAGGPLAAHLTAQGIRTGSTRSRSSPGAAREAWRDPRPSWSLCTPHQRGCTRPELGEKRQEPPGHPTGMEDQTRLPRQRMAPAMKLGKRGQRQLEVPTRDPAALGRRKGVLLKPTGHWVAGADPLPAPKVCKVTSERQDALALSMPWLHTTSCPLGSPGHGSTRCFWLTPWSTFRP